MDPITQVEKVETITGVRGNFRHHEIRVNSIDERSDANG